MRPEDLPMADDDWLRDARSRLKTARCPDAWIALIVRAIAPQVIEAEGRVDRTPAHFLLGAWAPRPDGLVPRLPEFAAIASPDATRALRELFVQLPPSVPVVLVDESVADAALLARMVLLCDANLEAWQRGALERFVEVAGARLEAGIRAQYTDREADFERFRGRVLGTGPDDDPVPGAGAAARPRGPSTAR